MLTPHLLAGITAATAANAAGADPLLTLALSIVSAVVIYAFSKLRK